MPSEVARIESWISSTLRNDSALNTAVGGRIFSYLAPQGATYPFVVYSFHAGRDVQGLGTSRIITRPLYLIKVITKGSSTDNSRTAADRIDELIGKAVSQVKDGYVFSARRVESISFQEEGETADVQYRHVGGLFRIEAHPQ